MTLPEAVSTDSGVDLFKQTETDRAERRCVHAREKARQAQTCLEHN